MTYDPKNPDNNAGRDRAVSVSLEDSWGNAEIDVLFDMDSETYDDCPYHPDNAARRFTSITEGRATVLKAWIGDLMLTRDMLAGIVNIDALEAEHSTYAVAAE